MKNQNFYMRVISLLLVILAVLFYNSSMKAQANEKEIAALTDKVDTLQEQQNELLSALETSYANRVKNQSTAAETERKVARQTAAEIMSIKTEPIQEKHRVTVERFRLR